MTATATSVASIGRRVEQAVAHAIRESGQFRGLAIFEAHNRNRFKVPALVVRADESGPWEGMPNSTGCRELLLSLQLVANAYDTPQGQFDQWQSDVMSMVIDADVLMDACNKPASGADERPVIGLHIYDVIEESNATSMNGRVIEWESVHRLPVGIHD